MFSQKLPQLRERRNVWLVGDGDIGRSSIPSVFFRPDDILFKPTNKWWDNYRGEKVVLLQDVDENLVRTHRTPSQLQTLLNVQREHERTRPRRLLGRRVTRRVPFNSLQTGIHPTTARLPNEI